MSPHAPRPMPIPYEKWSRSQNEPLAELSSVASAQTQSHTRRPAQLSVQYGRKSATRTLRHTPRLTPTPNLPSRTVCVLYAHLPTDYRPPTTDYRLPTDTPSRAKGRPEDACIYAQYDKRRLYVVFSRRFLQNETRIYLYLYPSDVQNSLLLTP